MRLTVDLAKGPQSADGTCIGKGSSIRALGLPHQEAALSRAIKGPMPLLLPVGGLFALQLATLGIRFSLFG